MTVLKLKFGIPSEKAKMLDQLVIEAKTIIDDPDGYDMLFDFVLGVAGLYGDPEYQ